LRWPDREKGWLTVVATEAPGNDGGAEEVPGPEPVQPKGAGETQNPREEPPARGRKADGNVSSRLSRLARNDRVELPGLPAVTRDEDRRVDAPQRVRSERARRNLLGVARIDGEIRFAVLVLVAAQ